MKHLSSKQNDQQQLLIEKIVANDLQGFENLLSDSRIRKLILKEDYLEECVFFFFIEEILVLILEDNKYNFFKTLYRDKKIKTKMSKFVNDFKTKHLNPEILLSYKMFIKREKIIHF